MTKDTEEFSQFTKSVACREYILPKDEKHLTRMVGFEGTPNLDFCWTNKLNMECKLKLNLQTLVRTHHGLSKFATD